MPDNPYAIVPVGAVFPYAGDLNNPANLERLVTGGWLPCDGRALDATNNEYAVLFEVIGTSHGEGFDDSGAKAGDFNLPDYRGRFLRGVDERTGRDPDASSRPAMKKGGKTGDGVGSLQTDEYKSHGHDATGTLNAREPFSNVPRAGAEWKSGFAAGGAFDDGGTKGVSRGERGVTVSVGKSGGKETRPVNAAVHWIIKFKQV
jgi:microcystin-dependent protein